MEFTNDEFNFLRGLTAGVNEYYDGYNFGIALKKLRYDMPPMPPIAIPTQPDAATQQRFAALEQKVADLTTALDKQNPDWGKF